MLEILTKFIFLQLGANTLWRDQTFDCRSISDNIERLIFYTNTEICLLIPIFEDWDWETESETFADVCNFLAFFLQLIFLYFSFSILTCFWSYLLCNFGWYLPVWTKYFDIWISSLFFDNQIFRYWDFLSMARVLDVNTKTLKTLLALEIKTSHSWSKVWQGP